ncbi:(2Fe-2S)-binding protein [Brevibacillus agri]|uniref:(2Fe-2S)-binding protein n=1 Tax=Brevibacillus agri TaxID=51101 RepID=UPI0024C0095F|nr:(2Fe-2S)-binding protein [Brevibacillus agri]WHX33162.1 (2Fe-2S)-binding protein [Brevibacillus agri]
MQTWNEPFLAEQFHLTTTHRTDALLSIKASDLLKARHAEQLVQTYAPLIKAHDQKPVGTYAASWLSGLALGLQYALSVWNVAIRIPLDQLTIELYDADGYVQFSFVVDEWHKAEGPSTSTARSAWRAEQYRQFYGHTLRPLFQVLADATGNPLKMIWGQLPTRFNYYLDTIVQEAREEAIRQRLRDDYAALCDELDGECFGLPKNPFAVKVRWVEDMRDPNKQVRLKNQCCLYYQTGDGQYCYTCPRLKEDERAARRQAALQA